MPNRVVFAPTYPTWGADPHEGVFTDQAADCIVMATGRGENALYHALRERGVSVEMIGDAVALRGTYEAVYEGHRAARKL